MSKITDHLKAARVSIETAIAILEGNEDAAGHHPPLTGRLYLIYALERSRGKATTIAKIVEVAKGMGCPLSSRVIRTIASQEAAKGTDVVRVGHGLYQLVEKKKGVRLVKCK